MENSEMFTKKAESLKNHLNHLAKKDIMVAFSGGVDSSLLLKILCQEAKEHHTKVYALTLMTKLHPMTEMDNAKKVASEVGAHSIFLEIDELSNPEILENPINRCYLCKKFLFQKILEKAKELQVETVVDGTNEDDLHVYRPGIQALDELGIISPLALEKFTKEEVRVLAKEYGISSSDRPSAPCLATRFPYGTHITNEKMRQVEKAEDYLKELGFYNVRVRVHEDLVRIEVDSQEFAKIVENKNSIISQFQNLGYTYITLDLEGFRSGSMDVHIKN